MEKTTFEQIQLFISLFKGRRDIYAKRWERDGKSGYSPAYDIDWMGYKKHKDNGGNFANFSGKKPCLLTTEVIQAHLEGKEILGIYPLLQDNTSYFIAADFDGENWQSDCKSFLQIAKNYSLPLYIERSRSGEGAHIWMFFTEKYPANKSRAIFLEIIRKALNFSQFQKEITFLGFFQIKIIILIKVLVT